jgi:integrin alpha FG-GAP repeat containing protein 1
MMAQGSLDILVQRSGATGQGKISFIQNNIYYDAFFLKAIGLLTFICNVACY